MFRLRAFTVLIKEVWHVFLLLCHAPFINSYYCASKFLLVSTRDVALEQYCIYICI